MSSTREQALTAILAVLQTEFPFGVVKRNEALPERVDDDAHVVLYDGTLRGQDITFGCGWEEYFRTWEAQAVFAVQDADDAARTTKIDEQLEQFTAALASDRTLGGLVNWCMTDAPDLAPAEQPLEGTVPLYLATVPVVFLYQTTSPTG